MTIIDLTDIVTRSKSNTAVARAFRRALGVRQLASSSYIAVKTSRFGGARRLMRQRYGVRM